MFGTKLASANCRKSRRMSDTELDGKATRREKTMLVLTRRVGEEIVIGGENRVIVTAVRGDRIRIGIDAPPSVRVDRQEIHQRITGLSNSLRNKARPLIGKPDAAELELETAQ